jgi:hypothetical protein
MSPGQSSIVVPVSIFFIFFASMYFNIWLAKKKLHEWKPYSTIYFIRSLGLGGIRNRASLIWMKQFEYDEAEAIILAKHQSLAIFEVCVGAFVVMATAANTVVR